MLPERDAPPQELPDDAKAWWPVLVDELDARGSLRRVTRHRLGIYCQLFAQYHRVTEVINREGQTQVHVYPHQESGLKFTGKDDEESAEPQQQRKRDEISAEALQQEKLVKALQRFDKEFGFLDPVQDPVEQLRGRLTARLGKGPAAHN